MATCAEVADFNDFRVCTVRGHDTESLSQYILNINGPSNTVSHQTLSSEITADLRCPHQSSLGPLNSAFSFLSCSSSVLFNRGSDSLAAGIAVCPWLATTIVCGGGGALLCGIGGRVGPTL